MKNANAPGYTVPPTANTYSPSVPISVYRELAAEVQAAQSMLEFLRNQNQQLTQQNQQLRQEIEKVVQSSLQLRQVADSFQPIGWTAIPEVAYSSSTYPNSEIRLEPTRPAPAPRSTPRSAPPRVMEPMHPSVLSEELFTEQEEVRHRHPTKPEKSSDLGGAWLMIAILLIVISAFGAGFLIVRPFLPTSR